MTYWTPGWPVSFAGNMATGQAANTYENFPGFDFSDAQGGRFAVARYNFPNGWFVGSERGSLGLNMNGLAQDSAFGGFHYQGTQFGYNFQNGLPITVYGGVDTLRYDPGIGAAFGPFDSTSSTPAGYSAHAGIEFRPTSNLSLSLGVGYTQQSTHVDSDINSPLLPGATPFAFGGRR